MTTTSLFIKEGREIEEKKNYYYLKIDYSKITKKESEKKFY